MENKELSTAKDNVAKKYGFKKLDDLYWDYNHSKYKIMDIINDVAIEYNRIMSERVDVLYSNIGR